MVMILTAPSCSLYLLFRISIPSNLVVSLVQTPAQMITRMKITSTMLFMPDREFHSERPDLRLRCS